MSAPRELIKKFESLKGHFEPGYEAEDMRDRAIYTWYAENLSNADKEEVLAVAKYATQAGYSEEALMVHESWSATAYFDERREIFNKYHVETVKGYPISEIASICRITRDAVYQRIRSGHPLPEPAIRIGKKEGWTFEQVRQWDKDFKESSIRA